MLEGWAIVALAVAYVGVLFAIAWFGDRARLKGNETRPLIYALSLAIYCTSWTFFGSVGLAAETGYNFIPVYLGPILLFLFGSRLVLRIVRLAKSQNITSVADFLASRYGKSPGVAAIATLVAVVGTLPYIALQLKAIVISTETLLGGSALSPIELPHIGLLEPALVLALALAAFAILFGTRHIDATEHQDGLMLAVAAESVVKLAAFIAVGLFVLFGVFGGWSGFVETMRTSSAIDASFAHSFNGGTWLTTTFLSFTAILLLPRQFHVTVVENHSEREIRRASWLLPLYLIAINLFVLPIAVAGLVILPRGLVAPDMYVLALPMAKGSELFTALAYIGGLSAGTAMVVVESVALAVMVCNGLVVPLLLHYRVLNVDERVNLTSLLLVIRRISIVVIVLAGFGVYRALGQAQGLAAIGLISFAAIAQLAPVFFGGLVWRRGTARGAIAGMLAGFAVWAYTLLLPWIVKAGLIPDAIMREGPFGLDILRPQVLFYLAFDPLTHGVLWSMIANVTAYVALSLWRAPEPIERLQAHIFVFDDLPRTAPAPGFRLWRTSITAGDLQATVTRYLGLERAERSFVEFARSRGFAFDPRAEADVQFLRFTEHLLTSAIGAASARLVMSLLLRRGNVGNRTALKLLDDASEALQYNRDLLQSALDQVRNGLAVFDANMQLVCWNRQFRRLLGLPPEFGRVGVSLDQILRNVAERGDFGEGPVDELVADRLMRLAVTKETFQERFDGGTRTIEIRTSAMPQPQGGIVCTFADITERVIAAEALARANETLERRVRERTAELEAVNHALGLAKAKADDANLDKTRFLAAASHDLMQPLNAARLYASSLVERRLEAADGAIASNIDASLNAVEEILSALIDISRMDAGRLEHEMADVPLADMIESLAVEFKPLAAKKGLGLELMPSSLWVRTDRRLLKRVLQNLIGNAVKYTRSGRVLVGVRRHADEVRIEVHDTGPGIPASQHKLIFKEFQRLEETAREAHGLGLGLSIVERICRVLDAPIGMRSKPGFGSMFCVSLPRAQPGIVPAAVTLAEPVAAGQLAGYVALCIDNEPAVLAGMQTLLGGWGCDVLLAGSAEHAVAVLAQGRVVPDVILADYHLDHGTGLDAIAAVRAHTGRQVPAVVISADRSPEVQRQLRDAGVMVLRKPLRAASLRSVMTHHAAARRIAAE